MTKAEIIEAINAVIRPNNEKAITAESLANLLTEIANATPESSGGGVVFTIGRPNEDASAFVLTEAEKAHNAVMFATIADADIFPGVSVDVSGYFEAMMEAEGINATGVKANVPSLQVLYAPADLATLLGEGDTAIIEVTTQFGTFEFYEDGSFISLSGE